MALFGSDDDDETGTDATVRFKPVTTDGNRVLGYLWQGDGDKELVWVPDSTFRTEQSASIDIIVE